MMVSIPSTILENDCTTHTPLSRVSSAVSVGGVDKVIDTFPYPEIRRC
jgi:hypothetical protein